MFKEKSRNTRRGIEVFENLAEFCIKKFAEFQQAAGRERETVGERDSSRDRDICRQRERQRKVGDKVRDREKQTESNTKGQAGEKIQSVKTHRSTSMSV